jgi:hypothetical protein
MSYRRLVLFVACLSVHDARAFADPTGCPSTSEGHALSGVSVFGGPTSELVVMVPVDGEWHLDPEFDPQDPFFLKCFYADTAASVIVPLPSGTTVCRIATSSETNAVTNIVCQ